MENKLLYITQSWNISRKDNTLFFENEKIKKIIPIVWIEQIFCLWEVTINSKLLQYLTENKIIVHFFNYHWYYSWTYYPRESYVSWKLFINQIKYYENNDLRLKIASNIVLWIAENMEHLLRHYQRHWKDIVGYIDKIKQEVLWIWLRKNIKEILFIEWTIWDIFYQSFKEFLPDEFKLNKRIRRPPDNPINALISFGNSVLYTYTLSKIYHTQLNPTISYLHEPFERRFSLWLDISEVFKLWLVFWNIFNLINKKIITVEKHFISELNYSVLNEDGRKIYLRYWDERVQDTINHPKLNRKVSYWTLIKYDCYKLIKFLMWEESFKPFSLKMWY